MDQSVKINLLTELNVQYRNLVNFLSTLPINEKFKAHCFQNLDQGIMWAQKGIELLEFVNAPAESSVTDSKAAQEKTLAPENETIN